MGGISIPALSSVALSGIGSIVAIPSSASPSNSAEDSINQGIQFRPPLWNQPALVMITIPAAYASGLGYQLGTQTSAQVVNGAGAQIAAPVTTVANAAPQFLVFDAVMSTSHSQQARPTLKPVQDSANITDHIILEPATLGLDILMSDAMPAYAPGQWIGNASKSISCFQVLDAIRSSRIPLTVTTRLKTYANMFIVNVPSEDTVKTRFGLRARIQFQQIFTASVSTVAVSARSQTTDTTTQGSTNPTNVPAGVTAQNGLPSTSTGVDSSTDLQRFLGTMPGAGNWSSNNTSQIVDDEQDGS